jgi:hypothetical protein
MKKICDLYTSRGNAKIVECRMLDWFGMQLEWGDK